MSRQRIITKIYKLYEKEAALERLISKTENEIETVQIQQQELNEILKKFDKEKVI